MLATGAFRGVRRESPGHPFFGTYNIHISGRYENVYVGRNRKFRSRIVRRFLQCIYCASAAPDLTDEHAIPLGKLPKGAPGLVLRNASCKRCSEITSAFERSVLQRLWQPARAGLGLRSYRKRNYAKEYPLTIVRNGHAEDVLLPLRDYPATMQLIEYPPPAYFMEKFTRMEY